MTSRGRGYNLDADWDPMRDDYNNSTYEPQYPDDDVSGGVKLDHCRLYITNIPKALNDEGLRTAFSKYGTLVDAFISKDPHKKYGLVSYETSGEAKLAMMKLNKTEPLKLNIAVAHKKRLDFNNRQQRDNRDTAYSNGGMREKGSVKEDSASVGSQSRSIRRQEEMAHGDNDLESVMIDGDMGLTDPLDVSDQLELEHLKLQEAEIVFKQRIIELNQKKRRVMAQSGSSNRSFLPDGRIIVRNVHDRTQDQTHDGESIYTAGAGDSNVCSCKAKMKRSWDHPSSSDEGSSTPSTCVLCSDDRSVESKTNRREYKDKSDLSKFTDASKKSDYSNKFTSSKTTEATSRKSVTSKAMSKKSEYTSKLTDTPSKRSDVTSKKMEAVSKRWVARIKSEATCDLRFSDLYDSDDDADETNRLIQLRNADYLDIVEDSLKIVIVKAGYPKTKMRLRQMEQFQKCLADVIDMQHKAGLLKKVPSFLDYYLNRGAIVCICKDIETRDWIVRIFPGLQERMESNLILLKTKLKRLCLAILKIPQSCWPATAQDTFKLLQYFNPTLKTDLWKIYSQKIVDNVECTFFLIDRVSGEIIRGPTFKNVINYDQMQFELNGYTEIYHECLLSEMEEDICSVASRVKLLGELRSEEATPRNTSQASPQKNLTEESEKVLKIVKREEVELDETVAHKDDMKDVKRELENSLQRDVLKKLKDVKYVSEADEVIIWSDETVNYSEHENEKTDSMQLQEDFTEDGNVASTSGIAVSDKTESAIESNDNLISRNSNLNIDSNRGIAYHRRTNYLHVENELKIAIALEGYPQNKLEGTHIRRLKHLFKEYLHKDMKMQRFANLIIPKFQDIYLSNGAVIYICDSLETKDYLTEVLPKFINSTGLKLMFRDIKSLVRYTRIVMRLPKENAHVESLEILMKLQAKYPGLKPDCWKYYSDVAGKQKRQFGVDPDSLEVIKSPDFDPTYEGERICFRIIDRQKRDVSFEKTSTKELDGDMENIELRKIRDSVLRNMYVLINPEITNAPLTRIRTNHYSDLIADDLKLYVGPSNYPETRVDETLFHSIKRTLENIVCESIEKGDMTEDSVPKFHDMYLFDGVIFIICKDMPSRYWIEQTLPTVNAKMLVHLKSTEFRGAVGIISLVVKTDKDTDEVITTLQKQNPRLRTKYWRKISTVRSKSKLDVVLQIDKLSALVITSQGFNRYVGANPVQFKLGHLQSLLKPKASLEELTKRFTTKLSKKSSESSKSETKIKSKVSMQGPKNKTFEDLKSELKKGYPGLKTEYWVLLVQHDKSRYRVYDLEIDEDSAKIIEKEDFKLTADGQKVFFYTGFDVERSDPIIIGSESPNSMDKELMESGEGYRKVILKVPINVLPESKDDLNIIFDLLEDKNPGLNTELWQVSNSVGYPRGKLSLMIDRQSVAFIQGKNFDPTIGGEKLKFYF